MEVILAKTAGFCFWREAMLLTTVYKEAGKKNVYTYRADHSQFRGC